MTLMLGYTYIWIDRYCIEQTNSEDKHAQIQQMGIMYSAADVVVVAASGVDLTYGLPGISRTRHINADTEVFDSAALINYHVHAIKGIQDSALASRAWTLQEGYLAKRRLYFTDTQIVCICNASVQNESDTGCNLQRQFLGAFDNSISPSGLGHKSSLDTAAGLLEEYTKRKLSYQSDALDGISGALEVLTSQDASLQHFHAVPSLSISGRGSRAYETAQIGLNRVHTRQATRRSEFPSWSPLGWEGSIRFHGHQLMSVEFRDEIVSLTADTRSLQVTAFRIKLSITRDYNPADRSYTQYVIIPRLGQGSGLTVVEPCWDSPPTHLTDNGTVHGMLLGNTGYGGPMVLLFVKHGSSFERVGCLPFNGRTAAESCRIMSRWNAEYREIGHSPEYLEDVWKKLGVQEIVVLR